MFSLLFYASLSLIMPLLISLLSRICVSPSDSVSKPNLLFISCFVFQIIGLKPLGSPYINCTAKVTLCPSSRPCISMFCVLCHWCVNGIMPMTIAVSIVSFFLLCQSCFVHYFLCVFVFLFGDSFCMLSLTAVG